MEPKYQDFLQRGITLHNPFTITLEIRPEQIAPGVEIYPGCRISGDSTSIGPHCRIGTEGPVTLQNCQLGTHVTFASGFAQETTMLDGVTIGANAHIRPGTLLEEQASTAHCVGLKQTMLMPFVTLGSLINFCDCLMAGGTNRANHSEVGSSFVHFNFTPRQDKATPSLFGDVPNGVLLNQSPIFLGGQCGVVGPVRIAYGCILAAGSVLRRDTLTPDTLMSPDTPSKLQANERFDARTYGNIDRVMRNNCIYIGNVHALDIWYRTVRSQWTATDPFAQACFQGARERIQQMVAERIKQLSRMVERLSASPAKHPSHAKAKTFIEKYDLDLPHEFSAPPEELCLHLKPHAHCDYITCIQSLPDDVKERTRAWLQSFVDNLVAKWEQTAHE